MLQLISQSIEPADDSLKVVRLVVERLKLAKRLWRGMAEDGSEFGFELAYPLKPGATFWQNETTRYVIEQKSESVLAISLAVAPSAAAGIGWAVGNLHMELQAEADRLLAADDPAVRQLLGRIQIPFTATTAVFRPGRFVRGETKTKTSAHELGPSHQH
jgi:urease accessory protein